MPQTSRRPKAPVSPVTSAFVLASSALLIAGACGSTTDTAPPQMGMPAGANASAGAGNSTSMSGASAATGGGAVSMGGGGGVPGAAGTTPIAGMPPLSQGGMPQNLGGMPPAAGVGGMAGAPAGGATSMAGAGGTMNAMAGGAGMGTGGMAGGLPADVIFTEDFETGSPGSQPEGWDNFISYNANFMNPNGNTYAVLDTAQVRPGSTQSLHVSGGQDPAQLTRALPQGTSRLYVRVYVYSQRQLGNVTEGNPNHETLIAIRGTPGQAGDEVRFGEIKGALGTNEVPSDNIAPKMEQWNSGPSASAGEWHCWEVAFLGDTAYEEVHAWLDGTEVHSITAATDWQNGELAAGWMSGKFVELVIGWQSFSNAANELWFDDLVVAGSRIGCE